MGGGLMQLVAYGAQDIYLTGNPQITFFKVVYRRHTNFSMESIQQTWNGTSDSSGRCTATISRNGDLVGKCYFEVVSGGGISTVANCGSSWIKTVELEIGGQLIDRHTGQWMEVFAELTQPNSAGIECLAAGTSGTTFQKMAAHGGVVTGNSLTNAGTHYVPLQFWFCRNPGLALPLIALQYHEVKIILDYDLNSSWHSSGNSQQLWVDYIYLDTDERRRFAQVSHEYLIEQIQYQAMTAAATSSTDLNFNHPVKELVWCCAGGAIGAATQSTLTIASTALTDKYKLVLNGHDRFSERKLTYFTRQQVHDYHSGFGGLGSISTSLGVATGKDSIAVYSFALKPEEHQPSGTCNFSRIDNAQLKCTTGTVKSDTNIYAVNYNVLRIMSGMGGLAYSN
jgi:hypothetical protein